MLALAAQHSPLLASAYASLSSDRLRQQQQPRFPPFEGRDGLASNGSAFETVLPRGGGVSPPSHRPPLSPASVCSSASSLQQTSSSNDLMSIERMVKGIDGSKNNLSDDQLSDRGLNHSPRSDSR
jgi:hypothetical protein